MKEKLIFRIFCMLCFFNFHVLGISKYAENSTNSKTNDEQLEKQLGDGKVNLLLIPFPFDTKHSARVNGETKTGDLGRNARRNEDPEKIMLPGDDGIKYTTLTNKDIYIILTSLASAGNVDASDNKGFVPNGAVNGKNGFTGFLMLGDEVFGKGNAAANDNNENLEGYKADGRENSHNIRLGGFQIGNGKEINLGINYAGNFGGFGNKENGNGFGSNSYGGLMEVFQHGSQQKGNIANFGLFGNGKSFGENFHSKGIEKFSIEDGKEGRPTLGFRGFGQGNAKENEMNNYNGGFSGLRRPIVNHYFNVRNGGGLYQDGLKYQLNKNRGFGNIQHERFRSQEMVHCERAMKEGIDEAGKANFAGGYSVSDAGNSNGKGGFVGRDNGYGISPLSFDHTPILSHSVSFSSSGDGQGEFLMEIGGGVKDGSKSEFSDNGGVTYHDKKAK